MRASKIPPIVLTLLIAALAGPTFPTAWSKSVNGTPSVNSYDRPLFRRRIPARTLRSRLEHAIELALERQSDIYGFIDEPSQVEPVLKSFRDFVSLCEAKELQTGEPVTIVVSY